MSPTDKGRPGGRPLTDRGKIDSSIHPELDIPAADELFEREWQPYPEGDGGLPEPEDQRLTKNIPDRDGDEVPPALAEVHATFRRWLYLPDLMVVDTSLATYVAHRLGGDPVWVRLIAPPGSGKTETLMAMKGLEGVEYMSATTAQAFISGMKDRKGGKEPSYLFRLQKKGKDFLILKDMGSILSMRSEARGEFLAQLRELYDGRYDKPFGTGETVHWEGRITLLAGATPAVDNHHTANAVLGERWVDLRLPPANRRAIAKAARESRTHEKEMRGEQQKAVMTFVEGLALEDPPSLSESAEDRLDALADFVSTARTGVDRDRYTREISVIPEPEAPTRLAKQLEALAVAFRVMGYDERAAMGLLNRVAESSIPRARLQVLRFLRARDGYVPTEDVADFLGVETQSARRILSEVATLRLLDRDAGQGGGNREERSHRWVLLPEARGLWNLADGGAS